MVTSKTGPEWDFAGVERPTDKPPTEQERLLLSEIETLYQRANRLEMDGWFDMARMLRMLAKALRARVPGHLEELLAEQ